LGLGLGSIIIELEIEVVFEVVIEVVFEFAFEFDDYVFVDTIRATPGRPNFLFIQFEL
jgi:hypothetical protein